MASKHYVGQRLSFEYALCTVRYIGPVAGTQKDWLGVEWDDPSRGKHDGEHQGVRYFSCRSHAKSAASFVRPSRSADPAQTFVGAVHTKYATETTERRDALASDLKNEIEISGKIVHEVGFDKIRVQMAQLHELRIVLVDSLRISAAETVERRIRQVCPKIVELDLSRNLFETCSEIINICRELAHLKSLTLNGNRLQIIADELESLDSRQAFSEIRDLSLDEVLVSWTDICTLVQHFTSLTTLTASSNEWTSVPPHPSLANGMHALTSLSLEYNAFTSLSDLYPLSELASLEKLHIKGNKIRTITSQTGIKPLFGPKLHYVDLSYNEIASWGFIDELPDVFQGLTSLRFSHNALYSIAPNAGSTAISADEIYMLTLARLAKLISLNFSPITAAERTNAEMFYLSRIGKAMAEVPVGDERKVTSQHRRYAELCDLYGEPTVVRAGTMKNPNFLEARLVKFTFYTPPNTEPGQDKVVVKEQEIPKGFDMYQVKGIVGRLFHLWPMKLRLVWETGEWDPVGGYEDEDEDTGGGETEAGVEGEPADAAKVKVLHTTTDDPEIFKRALSLMAAPLYKVRHARFEDLSDQSTPADPD
ncbi:MAG: hypothetical protein M1818_007504 [Claussenomyces sp. TS43310]|nr:MAG: hypothetical protein M1818_007504 [Claussenomyces sp. TS43310]